MTARNSQIQPFAWSVRRELWEHRYLYLAPLGVSALIVGAYLLAALGITHVQFAHVEVDDDEMPRALLLASPYLGTCAVLMMTGLLVGAFYCIDALFAERRDRSILFWKSLPVSDATAVLAKVVIPFLVLPLLVSGLTIATEAIVFVINVVFMRGSSLAGLVSQVPLVSITIAAIYGMLAQVLWQAPVYAWLLLVSAAARQAVFVWSILPPIALGMIERFVFGTNFIFHWMGQRIGGAVHQAFAYEQPDTALANPLAGIEIGSFLSNPDLWFGFVIAALFIGAAIRLRRYRGPEA